MAPVIRQPLHIVTTQRHYFALWRYTVSLSQMVIQAIHDPSLLPRYLTFANVVYYTGALRCEGILTFGDPNECVAVLHSIANFHDLPADVLHTQFTLVHLTDGIQPQASIIAQNIDLYETDDISTFWDG